MNEESLENISWFNIAGKTIFLLFLCYLTFSLFSSPRPWLFIDGANLLVHESGHFLFAFSGQTISFLGGSFLQTFIPFLIMLYFFFRKEYFASAFGLFWVGENLINVSVYIKDARTMTMNLVGGGIHDWNWLLNQWNLLKQDQLIGGFIFYWGAICVISSLILMIIMIYLNIHTKMKNTPYPNL
ncbi:hypothetical protein M1437_00820 [Patescibacteria group bacterium]|nr:hypothetical protein [Patescibacteria group bacterium]